MVHLLVLGLLALLFDCSVRCVDIGSLFLLHRFPGSGDSQSIVLITIAHGSGPVFASDRAALSLDFDEAEAGSGSTKKTERTPREPTAAGKAEARC